MDTKAIHPDANHELGVVSHQGKDYVASGYTRDHAHLVAYLGKDGNLTKWDGTVIGSYRIVSTWKTPRSYVSSTMHQVEATLADSSVWTGRSAGVGMSYSAKPKRTKRVRS